MTSQVVTSEAGHASEAIGVAVAFLVLILTYGALAAAGANLFLTDVNDGALLCCFHHHRVHDQGWSGRINPDDGHVEWKTPGSAVWERNHRWRP